MREAFQVRFQSGRRHLSQLRFQKQAGQPVAAGGVLGELSLTRIDRDDVVELRLQRGERLLPLPLGSGEPLFQLDLHGGALLVGIRGLGSHLLAVRAESSQLVLKLLKFLLL